MPVKLTLTSTEFNELSDDRKADYLIQPDMSYKLDLGPGIFTDTEDPAKLKSALESEREETRKAKAAADKLEKEKLEAERSKLTSADEIKAHYEKQLADERKKIADERKADERKRVESQTQAAEQMRKTKALEIASSMFGTNAVILLPHVEAMLKAVPGEQPGVEIIDPANGLAAIDQNFDNFKKSLSTNPLFAPMVVVSHASGGGANDGGTSTGLPSGTTSEGKPKTYGDYKPGELKSIKENDPARWKELLSTK